MTGKDLFIALGSISPKYYEEAENDFRIGQKVKVIVSSVDKLRGNIDFVLYHKNRYERETEKRYF